MKYEYRCSGCSGTFDVVKPVSEYNREELCPTSHVTMTRAFAPQVTFLYNTNVQEKKWQPALGKPTTDAQLKAEAKARGWIEVGNERPEKYLKPQLSSYDD